MKNLILISTAKNLFSNDGKPLPEATKASLKFLLLRIDMEEKLLIMKEYDPFEYHAEGLLDHMRKETLSNVEVNGGGKLLFGNGKLILYGKSYAFGKVHKETLKNFLMKEFPEYEVEMEDLQETEEMKWPIYDMNQVKYFVDNP